MEHKGTRQLETPRLILRAFRHEDARAAYRNWTSDPEVTRYMTWKTHYSLDFTQSWIDTVVVKYDRPDYYGWVIVLKSFDQPIGSIDVWRTDDEIEAGELGYCLGRRWWGQGIMPEAARAVLDYLFREVGMNRVTASHDVLNLKSGRVMEKIGMKKEGVLRAAHRNNRGIVDIVQYSILADEYPVEESAH